MSKNSSLVLSCPGSPVAGTLSNNDTEKKWVLKLMFSNSGMDKITVLSATGSVVTTQGTYPVEITLTEFQISPSASVLKEYELTAEATSGRPQFTEGVLKLTFTGILSAGGSLTADINISLL